MGDCHIPPASERLMYGGQAVVEGVMMRSPRFFAVACRRESDGEIIVEQENVESVVRSWQWMNRPFLRGVLALVDAVYTGTKALMYSANVQAADIGAGPVEGAEMAAPDAPLINGIVIGGTVFLSLALGIGLFWILPTLITQYAQHLLRMGTVGEFATNLSDGVLRIVFFLGYVALISRLPNVQRVFQYHGAEHKVINTFEAGLPLTLENARQSSRIHPRCGTNFIFVVLIVSIFVIALISAIFGHPTIAMRIPINLGSVLIVVGVSYEILKFAGKYRDQWWAKILIAPGLATQYMTTRIPDDSMIEVALAALTSVYAREHEDAPSEPAAGFPAVE